MPARLRRSARVLALLWVAQAALGALSGAATGPVATLAHLLLALLLAVAGFVLALALRRAQCTRAADALVVLLLLQVGLGAAAALGAAAPALVLAHNGGAVAGLALLAGWAFVPSGAAPGD
jgi:heme A synthase